MATIDRPVLRLRGREPGAGHPSGDGVALPAAGAWPWVPSTQAASTRPTHVRPGHRWVGGWSLSGGTQAPSSLHPWVTSWHPQTGADLVGAGMNKACAKEPWHNLGRLDSGMGRGTALSSQCHLSGQGALCCPWGPGVPSSPPLPRPPHGQPTLCQPSWALSALQGPRLIVIQATLALSLLALGR